MKALRALGGTSDLLPDESERWQTLEAAARALFHRFGFREIRTPVLEEADLFARCLGSQSEVVTKQMYRFEDRGGRQIVLRPEGTASAVRAFVERGLDKTGGVVRWYYLGPMFRAERPQAGRRRQFHQIGVEVFGSPVPYQDVEVILLLTRLLEIWGLSGAVLRLNNLGCKKDRPALILRLKTYFCAKASRLCADCKRRLKTNPLRILDCKQQRCRAIAAGRDIRSEDWICGPCRDHFETVLRGLKAVEVPWEMNPNLVRGLDYYTRTAFEVTHPGLGAQDALCGGGRYDDLVGELGGTATPAVGFALGVERVLLALESQNRLPQERPARPDLFVAAVGKEALEAAFGLLNRARACGVRAVGDLEGRPLKRQMEQAVKLGCRWVALLGSDEIARGTVTLKNLESRKQETVPEAELLERLR